MFGLLDSCCKIIVTETKANVMANVFEKYNEIIQNNGLDLLFNHALAVRKEIYKWRQGGWGRQDMLTNAHGKSLFQLKLHLHLELQHKNDMFKMRIHKHKDTLRVMTGISHCNTHLYVPKKLHHQDVLKKKFERWYVMKKHGIIVHADEFSSIWFE